VIIVEGPDGGGKSRLVRRLADSLQMGVAEKVVGSDTNPLTDLAAWTEDNVHLGFQHRIFDRHRLISEPIYGPATRSKQDPKFCDLGWVNEMMWAFYQCRPIIIYCIPALETVRENVYREDTDNVAVASRINAIYAAYVARATLDFCRGVGRLYNYETTRYDEVLEWTKFKLEERPSRDAAARALRSFPTPRQAVHPEAVRGGRRRAADPRGLA
jgi:hypothetical protein